jgi:ATP-binding cassette subfamily F protein 3
MSTISAEGLSLAYGAHDIFENCAFRVAAGDRIGLVGPNGSGKTSLLRLIVGVERPTGGRLTRARDTKLAYVPQQPDLTAGQTVYAEVAEVFAPLRAMEVDLLLAAEELAQAGDDAAEASARYEELSHRFEHAGGYSYESEIRRTLTGLGVAASLWLQSVDGLSGGERARVALAKALLERPDLLILDEPTNHLDLSGTTWLESLLRSWRGAFIVVSHDRYFLDQVVNRIWETEDLHIEAYNGTYSDFERQRQEKRERQAFEYGQQQEFLAKQEELIRRYGVGQRAKWAKGLEKRLSHVERIERPRETVRVKLDLGRAQRSGRVALSIESLAIPHPGDPSRILLHGSDALEIERGARVAILGPNGTGKTTLLRTVAGELEPAGGMVRLGYNTHLAYYRQGTEHLDEDSTVLDELLDSRNLPLPEARNLLARFLFRGDTIEKRVSALSGGERSRLALAKLSVSGANFLLLDEPTNHLDIGAREALEEVLDGYNGTILFVSHDRRFIDGIATEIWQIEDGSIHRFQGTYSEMVAAQQKASLPVAAVPAPLAISAAVQRQRKPTERDVSRFEDNVAGLETLLSDVTSQLERASERQDTAEIARLGRLYVETERALARALEEWEAVAGSG